MANDKWWLNVIRLEQSPPRRGRRSNTIYHSRFTIHRQRNTAPELFVAKNGSGFQKIFVSR
jgi:hypothetical protein